jgi:prepilin signal peptidase PulO-like enzyme (type II secretory pathway)
MILAAIIVLFAILAFGTLVFIGARLPDEETPHPPKCDCMTCGRKAVEKSLNDQVRRGW